MRNLNYRTMKTYYIILCTVLFSINLRSQDISSPDKGERRMERVMLLNNEMILSGNHVNFFTEQLQSVNMNFNEFLNVKNEFSEQVKNGENIWTGINEEYLSNMNRTWENYSNSLKIFASQLEEIMNRDQINIFYSFLLDELWYEGFITNENTMANESLPVSIESENNADTAEFIREYGREYFKKMLLDYNGGPDFPTKDDLVKEETGKEEIIHEVEPVYGEDIVEQYLLEPPWKGMDGPQATPASVEYLMEQQNLPALTYFHQVLFPEIIELISNR
jgi:hypothetical protein